MWPPTTRKQPSRPTARYQIDLTAKEWRLIEPHLPAARKTGRPRVWPMRQIVNAIFYVLRGGMAWRLLPSDFPPWPTVYRWFAAFRDGSVFEKINHALGPRGYDAGKKIKGRKRHALVDTDGRALFVEPHPANIQDRDAGGPLLQVSRPFFPFVRHVWADGGYNHERVTQATGILVEIVRKQPDQVGFAVLPRRWVIERFFACINRNRRLAKDFEATGNSAVAFLYAASAMLLIPRLARSS